MSSFGEASEIDCHQPIGDFVVVIQLEGITTCRMDIFLRCRVGPDFLNGRNDGKFEWCLSVFFVGWMQADTGHECNYFTMIIMIIYHELLWIYYMI